MNILVLCTGNSCRSQMAQGYFNHFANSNVTCYSAGIETHGLNPGAVAAMKRDGIDISGHSSNHIDEYRDVEFDLILTVCDHAHENCPFFPSKAERIHNDFMDPSKYEGTDEEKIAKFNEARDQIKDYVYNALESRNLLA